MKNRFFLILVVALLMSVTGFAQNLSGVLQKKKVDEQTTFNLEREIFLGNHSRTENILVNIERHTKKLELEIVSQITSGKLTIEIYDPHGKKRGTFLVETQLDSSIKERAKGNITKSLKEPAAGDWNVKIIPESVNGVVLIQAALML